VILRFPACDLTDLAAHRLKFSIRETGDENPRNDQLVTTIYAGKTAVLHHI